jgi:DNA (cytosine-5)-methyltransferase 1
MAAALDSDPSAVETLRANRGIGPAIVVRRDIREFGPRAMERRLLQDYPDARISIITAGPPCQGWSQVGRGKLRSLGRLAEDQDPFEDPRNRLYRHFIRYVSHFQPAACVMENVPGMARYKGQDMSVAVRNEIEQAGYQVSLLSLSATQLGVPQLRTRLLFVGIKEDLGARFIAPSRPPEELDLPPREIVVNDAIRDLPWIRDGAKREAIRYAPRKPKSRYSRLLRPAWMDGSVSGHITRSHRQEDIEAFAFLPQGGIYRDLPKRFRRYRVDIFPDKYRRLSWERPSPCLTAHLSKDCYSHIHPSQSRTISVREAARLQGFPDWYRLEGSMGSRYRLLGNAVPPLVSYAIGKALAESLSLGPSANWHAFSEFAKARITSSSAALHRDAMDMNPLTGAAAS